MSTEIKTILQTFSGDIQHGQGASIEDIARCESVLGIRFIGQFEYYIRQFGWLSLGSSELYGLGENIEPWRDLKGINLSERVEMHPPLPSFLVTFYNDGFGNQHCLESRSTLNGEHPIVFWDHELGPEQIPTFISSSFSDWLRDLITI